MNVMTDIKVRGYAYRKVPGMEPVRIKSSISMKTQPFSIHRATAAKEGYSKRILGISQSPKINFINMD